MDILHELVTVIENSRIKKAREEGRKIVGYTCLATPREILDAAGIIPYRIKALASGETDMADAYLSRFNCGFCRACLQLGMDGTYEFLDGIIETNGCDHLRGMFENWQHVSPREFFYYLRVPHQKDEDSLEWLTGELELLVVALQDHFNVAIGEQEIMSAIEQQDRIADKMREIYMSRWNSEVKIPGSEVMSLSVAEGSLPADEFEQLIDDFMEKLPHRKPLECRARLFMGGAATDEIGLISELEDLGGIMVADSFCFGTRLFRREAVSDVPLRRLAETYLLNLLCPRMFLDFYARENYIMEMIEKSRSEGAILFHNKFCDLHGIENVKLRLDLEKKGIPVLILEKEYGATADIGRLKTRVQAFLERIER